MPTAITDNLVLTLEDAKTLLGITNDLDDAWLTVALAAAKEWADTFVSAQDFSAAQYTVGAVTTIPEQIKVGVIKALIRDAARKRPGLLMQKRDAIQESYSVTLLTDDAEITRHWLPYRLEPGFGVFG